MRREWEPEDLIARDYTLTVIDNDTSRPTRWLACCDMSALTVLPQVSRSRASIDPFLEVINGHRILLKRFVAGCCFDVLPSEHLLAAGAALARLHMLPVPTWLRRGTPRVPDVSAQLAQFEEASLQGCGHLCRNPLRLLPLPTTSDSFFFESRQAQHLSGDA